LRDHGLSAIAILPFVLLSFGAAAQSERKLVDIIPKSFSNEPLQESEPGLTINPLNPFQIIVTAFTQRIEYCGADVAPVFYSIDGGLNWEIKCWLPSPVWTHDATLRFSPSGQIYGGIIRLPDQGFLVVRGFPLADRTLVPILTRVPPDTNHIIDQPDLEMTSNSRDEVAIGENDGRVEPPAPTASVDESYNAGDKTPTFQLGKVDKRSSWFDLPPIRVAAHRNGTIYAAFIAIHGYDAPSKQMIGDIVVVRGRRDANTHLLCPRRSCGSA